MLDNKPLTYEQASFQAQDAVYSSRPLPLPSNREPCFDKAPKGKLKFVEKPKEGYPQNPAKLLTYKDKL